MKFPHINTYTATQLSQLVPDQAPISSVYRGPLMFNTLPVTAFNSTLPSPYPNASKSTIAMSSPSVDSSFDIDDEDAEFLELVAQVESPPPKPVQRNTTTTTTTTTTTSTSASQSGGFNLTQFIKNSGSKQQESRPTNTITTSATPQFLRSSANTAVDNIDDFEDSFEYMDSDGSPIKSHSSTSMYVDVPNTHFNCIVILHKHLNRQILQQRLLLAIH